jgi:GNAT superfamily N-acetyltransferase
MTANNSTQKTFLRPVAGAEGRRTGDAAVTLRPVGPDDDGFLAGLYASTRELELSQVPWSAGQKAAFLRMQFDAQCAHYRQHYADASFDVVLVDGEPAGRLYVARWPNEIRIVDIAFLPDRRGRGIGTRLIGSLQREAGDRGVPLTIHVERLNPALALYERLGFTMAEDKGVYLFLEWRPHAPEA